ncbi:MAG: hypothetical protein CMD27_03105 [Flavobacteriales bacterium]|jgi:hypothetical protein|nr:hypothetical protein [Flavobacteriales bacterium]|tara:strand:+ start:178 stop:486 length:309 start_codon:yes stop_codon:yes gene_type:complete
MLQKLKKIQFLKNTDLFNIRSFITVFVIYSFISVWLANVSVNKDFRLRHLVENHKIIKSEYVRNKTILMTLSKRSNLLQKANSLDFFSADKPIIIIQLDHEN